MVFIKADIPGTLERVKNLLNFYRYSFSKTEPARNTFYKERSKLYTGNYKELHSYNHIIMGVLFILQTTFSYYSQKKFRSWSFKCH